MTLFEIGQELSSLTYIAFVGTVTAACVGAFVVKSYRQWSTLNRTIYSLGILLWCMFGIVGVISGCHQAQNRLVMKQLIRANQRESCLVTVDGIQQIDAGLFVAEVANVGPQLDRHSEVTAKFKIDIKWNSGALNVVLGQDSRYKDEFWVWFSRDGQLYRAGTLKSAKLESQLGGNRL